MKLIPIILLLALRMSAQSPASVATLVGAQAADIHSSWGRPEANPIIGERFGYRGVMIKAATTTGIIFVERKYPRHRKLWTTLNYVGAGVVVGVAIRNYKIRKETKFW